VVGLNLGWDIDHRDRGFVFSRPLQANAGAVTGLGHDFISIRFSLAYHSTPRGLAADSVME
jgi:hypothetical protein